jgi:hypothetical protein
MDGLCSTNYYYTSLESTNSSSGNWTRAGARRGQVESPPVIREGGGEEGEGRRFVWRETRLMAVGVMMV